MADRNSTCRGRSVLRQSRLHSGVAQVLLVLFALLAGLAPVSGAPAGGLFGDYVSSPGDPCNDAGLIATGLEAAEEFEDDDDQEGFAGLVSATFDVIVDDDVRASETWPGSFPRLSAHFGTGPPSL